MADIVRYGVLSTAQIALNRHLPAAQAAANSQVVAIASRDQAKADKSAGEHGIAKAYGSYQALLHDPDIDAVINPLPNSMHCEWSIKAAQAGKHILCEKPLAVTVAECARIVAAARDADRQVMVGHGARFSKIFVAVHKLVRDGMLGEACFVEGDYVHDLGPLLDLPGHDWWLDAEREGQLPIIGGACHPLDLMRWIAGEIVEVSAYGANRNLPAAPWCDTVIANLKFASGALGKCLVSCGAKIPYAMNFGYYGTKGSVLNDRLFIDGIPHADGFMQLPVEIRTEDHTCAEQLEHFLACIQTGDKPLIDALDGARSVAVCCAVAESIEAGRPVAVQLDF